MQEQSHCATAQEWHFRDGRALVPFVSLLLFVVTVKSFFPTARWMKGGTSLLKS